MRPKNTIELHNDLSNLDRRCRDNSDDIKALARAMQLLTDELYKDRQAILNLHQRTKALRQLLEEATCP